MNKYGPGAKETIEKTLHKYKKGELKSGSTGKKVSDRKQAIAIGISEAKSKQQKVPNRSS